MRLTQTIVGRAIFGTWVPGLGMLGAGIAAVGAFYQVNWITFFGAMVASVSAMVSAVRQSETTERLEVANVKLAEQSEQIVNLVTGGDSVAYLTFPKDFNRLAVIHHGSHPLFEVNARIVDLARLDPASPETVIGQTITVGSIPPKTVFMMGPWALAGDRTRLNIMFNARNGFWAELFRRVVIDNQPQYAIKVTRDTEDGSAVTVFEQVDPLYPRNDKGEVDWD
jgi:hypothetical protein